jgi:serine protease Do
LDGAVSSIGSGFFISGSGILVTNFHVLDGAYSAAVRLADGSPYPISTVLARNPLVDLIKVKVDIPDNRLRRIVMARHAPAVMDRVVVIGTPMGLEQTVSEGIISAIREMPTGGAVLQLTAPISPGSSGGPVLNHKGEAVGVVTFQAAKGQNLNVAISIDAMDLLTEETQGLSIAEWTIRNSMKGPVLAAMLCSKGA